MFGYNLFQHTNCDASLQRHRKAVHFSTRVGTRSAICLRYKLHLCQRKRLSNSYTK